MEETATLTSFARSDREGEARSDNIVVRIASENKNFFEMNRIFYLSDLNQNRKTINQKPLGHCETAPEETKSL